MKHSKNDLYDSIVSDFKSVLSLHSDKRVISVDVRYDICEVRYSIGSTQVAQWTWTNSSMKGLSF